MNKRALTLSAFAAATLMATALLPVQAGTSAQHKSAAESAQIVNLMPVLLHHEQSLDLTAEQKAFFAAWMKKYPPRRAEIEQDVADMRAKLRALILEGGHQAQRDFMIQQLGASHAQLLMMSALDVETVQEHLSKAQYRKLVDLYRAGEK
ncbi:hypothetical protein A9404_06490 [Halothiobacillus diazotrophicus]|uniref:Zinc resistance-associated protein n=1 Tax=Halothiobacillus diazotrophicus TaxID=1860122 RepID=A0A191ZGU9_9GAMM|nr:hypothetical protein [Halothiobacillus diazotrophicus]ANJ67077.1 hypothetical protein A9404_06490 [Halothiobacillus diazotrophicus]